MSPRQSTPTFLDYDSLLAYSNQHHEFGIHVHFLFYLQPFVSKMGKKLFVGNLSFQSTDDDLQVAFEQYGEVEDCKIILDRETGRSRGFGFVTFCSEEDAEKALSMDGQELGGRNLRVNFATDRDGGSSGGGGRRGGGGGGRAMAEAETETMVEAETEAMVEAETEAMVEAETEAMVEAETVEDVTKDSFR